MRARVDVSTSVVALVIPTDESISVCLVVYSLLAETPEDVVFYWK
jgi:hypothetical protein